VLYVACNCKKGACFMQIQSIFPLPPRVSTTNKICCIAPPSCLLWLKLLSASLSTHGKHHHPGFEHSHQRCGSTKRDVLFFDQCRPLTGRIHRHLPRNRQLLVLIPRFFLLARIMRTPLKPLGKIQSLLSILEFPTTCIS
jgi:hypothetical protein